MKRFLPIFLFLLLLQGVRPAVAQTDTEFWFAIPKVSQSHNWHNRKFFFRFATLNLPATITISMPADPGFVPIVHDVPANTAITVQLPADEWQNPPLDLFYQMWNEHPDQIYNRGILITATNNITAYFEVGTNNNPDIFALKGRNALGNDFFVPFQDIHFNQPLNPHRPYSAIYIVATEDNTELTITPTRPVFPGRPAGVPFNINLNRGQSIAIAPDDYTASGQLAENRLAGTRVQSDKPIAVSTSDDSVRGLPGGCYDLIGDQLIPTSIIGTEYIAMRGRLTINEYFYVLATEPNTQVEIDGVIEAVLQPGEQFSWEFNKQTYFIKTSKPSYVYHVAGFGCELGGAVLPPINVCTGSTRVAFTRSLGGANGRFFLNILARAGAEDGFIFNGDGPNTIIPAAAFQPIPGTVDWLAAEFEFSNLADVPVGAASLIENTKDVFHLGIINGGPTAGTMYGYFSDFNPLNVQALITGDGGQSLVTKACFGEPIQLVAQGGTKYSWHPPDFLDDPTSDMPITLPDGSIKYTVTVSGACNMVDSASVFIEVADPVIALFTIDESVGCSPFEITVQNESYGVSNYSWTMGDGTVYTTAAEFFDHTYTNTTDSAVTYQLRLIGRNTLMCRDTLITAITVYPEVHAHPEPDIISGCAPLQVNFENSSTGAESFTWKFDDGSTSTERAPTHVFQNFTDEEKTYQVVLTAKSAYGCISRDTVEIVVQPYIETGFHLDPPSHCNPYPVEITNTSFGATTNLWSFDGGLNFEENDNSQFTELLENNDTIPKVFEIWLIGENAFGCMDTLIKPVTVYPPVISEFAADVIEGCNPLAVEFNNLSAGAQNYLWDFDSGEGTSSETHPVVLFENPSPTDTAVFNVSLLATSEYLCTDIFEQEIRVYPRIRANFTFDYTSFCTPQEVTFINTSAGGVNYYWDFGDGNFVQDNSPYVSHEYVNENPFEITYPVSLVIENASGCTDTLVREVTIFPQIQAGFNVTTSGCHPLEVNFENTSTGASTYMWDFGDGGSSQEATPSRIFTNESHYNNQFYQVRLLVESIHGCRDSIVEQIIVHPKPKADYSVSETYGCSPLPVSFEQNALGANFYSWDFGDGNQQNTSQNTVSHIFQNSDDEAILFTTRLIASNYYGCKDTLYKNLQVFPEITAAFQVSETSGCHPLEVDIINNSQGATAANPYLWNYGEGNVSGSQDTVQSYVFNNFSHTQNRNITVKLKAQSYYGCKDSTEVNITVHPRPKAGFEPQISEGCSPLHVGFTDGSIGANEYSWDFGDGYHSQIAGSVNHVYHQPHDQGLGQFTAELYIENQYGCEDTTTRQITVYPQITAEFSAVTEGCHPLQVSFDNFSLGVDQHTWSFGDGSNSNEESPEYIFLNESYTEVETYFVSLQTQSNYGCEAEIIKEINVFPRPLSDFVINVTHGCSPLWVEIENLSIGGEDFHWKLGNTTSYTAEEVFQHAFRNFDDNPQAFSIELTAMNEYGCSRQSAKLVNVFPEVVAEFTADNPHLAGCNPLPLSFENLSERAHEYLWTFGDGSHSTTMNPSKVYHTHSTHESYYEVMLRSQSVYGCKDSLLKLVRVYPEPVADLFVSPHTQIYPNTDVLVENLSAPGNFQYHWDMGDGTSFTKDDKSPFDYTYVWSGGDYATRQYTVILKAGNEFCNDSISQNVVILAPHPVVGFEPAEQGCPPLEVQFRNETQYGLEFFWDFDDGNHSHEENPRHIFHDPGEYIVKLLVSGEGGLDSAYQTITVFEPPVANFRARPPLIQLPYEYVQMVNLSSLGAYFEWHMGDGQVYYEYEPEHQYEKPGLYDVTLIVGSDTDPQCFDEITKEGAVTAEQNCKIIFPNAFTPSTTGPNGGAYITNDPANHVFYPVYTGISEYKLEIYNRWGEFIFRSEDLEIGWDGYFRGRLSPMDVYVWKVWVTCTDGTEIKDAGDVTLYR
ncbi:MAG: PKD domain-containing protein [Bacteroidetes bacterium]|nr:MAG: PKD domain-containing protein [Bacteroidota bacterium]